MATNEPQSHTNSADPAVGLIRQKIAALYSKEPNAKKELAEAEATPHRSHHQQFMHELSTSGKSLAEIQTAWHNYYVGLSDTDKHKVWQEFYESNNRHGSAHATNQAQPTTVHAPTAHSPWQIEKQATETRTVSDIKHDLMGRLGSKQHPSRRQHLHSLLFGLSFGTVTVLFLLFGFFNERFIAPFISPSRNVSATPIIIDPTTSSVGPESKIIIPKINVELPIVFDAKSIDEKVIQQGLNEGVVHYPTTPYPGELGNGAIFGHSSNNILNQGKYKFAFVLLRRLEIGDTFMINYNSKRYVYKIFDRKVVKPEDVSVLANTTKPASFALITCDPPGTSLNRLVVWGEQISPEPNSNIASTATKTTSAPKILPSNSQTLWQRISQWFSN